ncbi:MAG: inorganic phosphate transporter [Bacteroidetes bacterium]|nr:inorganic phosphate transporter [Bacteroidota bacterium]
MDFFFIAVIILFILAISDLIVGVSNDAVNFLNSAIGSKVAPRYIIMIVASLGILVGTTFSSGLMEVARKGIFNPEMFYFSEIMIIFLAVMITDVLLLDLYNTFGLPTSTTVSIVFELLGAAVAISTIKVLSAVDGTTSVIDYINTSKALGIVSGILLSVVVSFTAGAIIQFFTRLVFTFDYQKRIKRYGAIFGAITLTAITFFLLLKGVKGATFISSENADWIKGNLGIIMLYSVLLWGFIFQLLLWFTKINILKPIVLVGTFALALAFAANDLVNFIGVPLAGLSSYQITSGLADPLGHLMVELTGKVETPTILLLIAGIIMVLTLWKSKKAQTVTQTELNLSRQDEGSERFESSLLSRVIVRMSIAGMDLVKKITPKKLHAALSKRFDTSQSQLITLSKKEAPSFDMLRASVNLMVASVLISFATSLKLPLSTTYVTFMVAMGTSLADKSWGRESAVYRINGVITVIGGWFFTAFMAFTVSAIFATIIYYGGIFAITILVGIAAYIIFRTHILHKTREKEEEEVQVASLAMAKDSTEVITALFSDITLFLKSVSLNMTDSLTALFGEDRTKLKEARKNSKKIKKHANLIVSQIINSVKLLKDVEVKQGRRYGKIIGSIQEVQAYLKEMNELGYRHIDNNHGAPDENEINDLRAFNTIVGQHIEHAIALMESEDFSNCDNFNTHYQKVKDASHDFDENEIVRIKENKSNSRNSLLFLSILSDMENISNHVYELISVCRKNYQKINISDDQPEA